MGNEISIRELAKLWHIPGNLESHIYIQVRTHTQEIHEKSLITTLTDLEDLHNQKVKAMAELLSTSWSVEIMPQQTQRTSW